MEQTQNRHILVVDDEPDVCEIIAEVLAEYRVTTVNTYDAARSTLSSDTYDAVILDIMGVYGLHLLALYGGQFPCIILTANALTAENLKEVMGSNGRLFLPKDEIVRLDAYVAKVIEVKTSLWDWLLQEIDFSRYFGEDWTHPEAS